MGVKNKKNKKPKNSIENKQEHAFDEGDKILDSSNNAETVPKTKKKPKKKQQKEGENIKKDPVSGKKRKQVTVTEDTPAESIDSPKKKKKKSKSVETATSPDKTDSTTASPEKPKKKKKISKSSEGTTDDLLIESTTIPAETEEKTTEPASDDGEPKEEKKLAYDHADEKRTVFCGNIPNETGINQTTIKNLFAQYGKIKTVRMRSETGNILFSKKNKKSCSSFNAYVVFENIEDAKKAIQLNGYKLKENHLRVNMANSKNKAFQSKGTIFIGNLPFDSTEKEVRELFSESGTINYVRIIPRKGICYVCFDKGGTALVNALKLNDTEFKGRNIRVTRCESKDKQEKKKLYKIVDGKKIRLRVKKSHKLNEELVRGRGSKAINNPIVKKIKDSQKAKFNRFTNNEQVSKKDLFRRGGKFDKDNREVNRNKMKQKKAFFGSKVDGDVVSGKKKGVKKGKINKTTKDQKVIAKKLKSAAMRSMT